MRAAVISVSLLSALIYIAQLGYRYERAHEVQAPCGDAIGAFLVQHWECSRLSYTHRLGFHFVCLGADYQLDDNGMTDERRRKLIAFMYTNLDTMKQGFCDCTRLEGNVCEDLE